MIRINRLIKKDSIFKLLELPHVAKIEIKRGKANQKDPKVVRVMIYLTCSHLGNENRIFNQAIGTLLHTPNISNELYATLLTAKRDGFIKESTYNKFNVKLSYSKLCQSYDQAFFDKL
jgi:hypothetical protein